MLFVLGERLLRRRAAVERDCENHTAKESDAMKKLLAQLQRRGAKEQKVLTTVLRGAPLLGCLH